MAPPRIVLPTPRGPVRAVVERTDPAGRRVQVTLSADRGLDARALDLLAQNVAVVEGRGAETDPASAPRPLDAEVPGWDVTVTITSPDGADVSSLAIRQPPEFDQRRPGTLRPSSELLAALSANRNWRVPRPLPDLPRPTPTPVGGVMTLTGALTCRAPGGAAFAPLQDVELELGAVTAVWSGASFTARGYFPSGNVAARVRYRGAVTAGAARGALAVVDDIGSTRSDSGTARVTRNGTTGTASIEITSIDCETWRLGHQALADFLTVTGAPPPAGGLTIRRQAGVRSSPGITPSAYAHYDTIVLPADWLTTYASSRRSTIFHEFGHTVRHVADGDFTHWNGDLFRFAYARSHGGCETFNRGFAFNEGWAGYWAFERAGEAPSTCGGKSALYLDWTEHLIAARLSTLAQALSPGPAGSALRATRMQSVLRSAPGKIHTLRDFEVRYCALFAAGNPHCVSAEQPQRPAPSACPPEFVDDGLTCRLPNIMAKDSRVRGAATPPTGCPSGQENQAGLCYPACPAGFRGVGVVCWQDCPAGFRDDGAYCGKPAAYGRGVGYGWQFGDAAFRLDGARARCVRDNPDGCEAWGAVIYPKCRANFHPAGCCVCTPDCPSGMNDIGVSCQKRTSTRAASIPRACAPGQQLDAGLCYATCPTGFVGVGPVCWQQSCPAGWADHGATCYRDPLILVKI